MTKVLITGGAGFVGHHFVESFLKNTDWNIVVLDALNYAASGFDRLRDINVFDEKRVSILTCDISAPLHVGIKKEIGDVDFILHLAAESHVDKSIEDPMPFVMSNVVGTVNMLNFAKEVKGLKCFFLFSTDECFGPAPDGVFYKENDRHNPGNPYAASKSSSEMFAKAYRNTYKMPIIITRSMNIIGERQHPEKYIPMCVRKILNGEKITIHADKTKTRPGSRFYIHARNVADAYLFLLSTILGGFDYDPQCIIGEDYHIVGEREVDNLEIVKTIGKILGKKPIYELVDFHSSRPGHDLRYALDGDKLADLGWSTPMAFEESLSRTVNWMISPGNIKWLKI
jgi:dTDP-glucose 4,6-dehydratase